MASNEGTGVCSVVGAIAGIAYMILRIASAFSPEGKTMKAPGRDGRILREVFEKDPAGYFRNLRGK